MTSLFVPSEQRLPTPPDVLPPGVGLAGLPSSPLRISERKGLA